MLLKHAIATWKTTGDFCLRDGEQWILKLQEKVEKAIRDSSVLFPFISIAAWTSGSSSETGKCKTSETGFMAELPGNRLEITVGNYDSLHGT